MKSNLVRADRPGSGWGRARRIGGAAPAKPCRHFVPSPSGAAPLPLRSCAPFPTLHPQCRLLGRSGSSASQEPLARQVSADLEIGLPTSLVPEQINSTTAQKDKSTSGLR